MPCPIGIGAVKPFTQEFYDGLSTEEKLHVVRMRLEHDDAYYLENCIKIVDQHEREIPLKLKQAQRRLVEIKARQERARVPVRIIVLKARKEGISTAVQALSLKRTTQRRNHRAQVVAHDNETSEEIFGMGEFMYEHLPDETIAGLQLKPPVSSQASGQQITFGEPSRAIRRQTGNRGLNSSYKVDTANQYEKGRGKTPHTLHMSELGFYQNPEKKAKALFNAIPDTPNTMIIIESTANGFNYFRKLWINSISGRSNYAPLFIAWFEDPQYSQPFAHEEEREEFISTIGKHEYGEAEPELIAIGVTPEQLKWRRQAIINKANGDLRDFMQEYPANWQEAFLATGRQVFSPAKVAKIIERTESTGPEAEEGVLQAGELTKSTYMGRDIQVPAKPFWLPASQARGVGTPMWRRWEGPDPGVMSADPEQERPPGQYVIELDAASGVETASEGSDYFAIQIINHRTRAQVARWRARGIDPDVATQQLYLAALFYSIEVTYPDGRKRLWRPWVAIETTGGYGLSAANTLWRKWKYPNLYFRRPAEHKGEKQEDRLGWSTDHKTKPLIVDHAQELIGQGVDGIRDPETAAELQTYVRDKDSGKMGAEEDYFDDLLESWMIAQIVVSEKPLRRLPKGQQGFPRAPRAPLAPSMGVRPRMYGRSR